MISQSSATAYIKKLAAPFIIACFFLSGLSSCGVTKQPAYFRTLQKDTTLTGFVTNDFESKIRKGDQLAIQISSLSPAEDALFNAAGLSAAASTKGIGSGGFAVLSDGTVELHRLGKVTAEGLTRKELANRIQKDMLAYMKDPIVQVNYLNHRITVIGEVATPQVLNLPEEQISVLDALVLSGDVSLNANRKNITIIRDNGTEKKVKHINLEDHSIFTSPWFYVQSGDIVLVSPDNDKYAKEQSRQKLQTTLSLAASGIGLLIIILDRVIK